MNILQKKANFPWTKPTDHRHTGLSSVAMDPVSQNVTIAWSFDALDHQLRQRKSAGGGVITSNIFLKTLSQFFALHTFQILLGSASGSLRLYNSSNKQVLQDILLSSIYPQVSQIAAAADSFVTSSCRNSELKPDSPGRIDLWKLTPSHVRCYEVFDIKPL